MDELRSAAASGSASGGAQLPPLAAMLGALGGDGAAAGGDADVMKKVTEAWEHMNRLSTTDPKAYAAFLDEQMKDNARSETEATISEALGGKRGVFPTLGFVLKLVTGSTARPEAEERKTFINVVSHTAVNPPTLPAGEPVVDKEGNERPGAAARAGSATIPLAPGHVRAIADNKGAPALVVDMVAHPWAIMHAGRDKSFRDGLVSLISESLLPELGWRRAAGAAGTPAEIRAVYKGGTRIPGTKAASDVVPCKFLFEESDRPANATHWDCEASDGAAAEAEAKERFERRAMEAMSFAATAAGGAEAGQAVEEVTAAKNAQAAAARASVRMSSPGAFLRSTRADRPGADAAGEAGPAVGGLGGAGGLAAPRAPTGPLITEVDDAAAEAATASSRGVPAAPMPAITASVAAPVAGSGVVVILVRAAGEASGVRLTVRAPTTVRLSFAGRPKPLVVSVPQGIVDKAAGGGGCSLVAKGCRVTRGADGVIRVRVRAERRDE